MACLVSRYVEIVYISSAAVAAVGLGTGGVAAPVGLGRDGHGHVGQLITEEVLTISDVFMGGFILVSIVSIFSIDAGGGRRGLTIAVNAIASSSGGEEDLLDVKSSGIDGV